MMPKAEIDLSTDLGQIQIHRCLQPRPDVVQNVSSHKKASHFSCPRNGRQFIVGETGALTLHRQAQPAATTQLTQPQSAAAATTNLRHELVDGLGVGYGVIDGQALGDQRLVVQNRCV